MPIVPLPCRIPGRLFRQRTGKRLGLFSVSRPAKQQETDTASFLFEDALKELRIRCNGPVAPPAGAADDNRHPTCACASPLQFFPPPARFPRQRPDFRTAVLCLLFREMLDERKVAIDGMRPAPNARHEIRHESLHDIRMKRPRQRIRCQNIADAAGSP